MYLIKCPGNVAICCADLCRLDFFKVENTKAFRVRNYRFWHFCDCVIYPSGLFLEKKKILRKKFMLACFHVEIIWIRGHIVIYSYIATCKCSWKQLCKMLLFMESSSTYLTWQIFMPDAFPDTIPKGIGSPLETEAGVFLLGECVNPYSMAPPSSIIAFQNRC